MLNNLVSDLNQYSKIAIFGFGKEGRSFYDFMQKYLPNKTLVIVDKNEPMDVIRREGVEFFSGDEYLYGLSEAQLIIKSPGISLYNLGIKHDDYNFTSITELFIKYYKKQIIGVTGTKGKSTLVTIMNNLFKNANQKVVLCGNIGVPAFDILDFIDEETRIVMELSSHQLLNIKYSPHIAILTNLFEEHLDYYENLQEYYDAKLNIMRFQDANDVVIFNLKDSSHLIGERVFKTKNIFNVFNDDLQDNISFNVQNGFIHKGSLQILQKLLSIVNINKKIYLKTIKEFKTLPHRLEYVDTLNGITYINDSISTIPEATIEAIKILKNVKTVIIGGYDRGVHYDSLVNFLVTSTVQNIILFSDTGEIIRYSLNQTSNSLKVFYMSSLKECINKAHEVTQENGSIVLFSPAASSFNEYKNFMERGDEFKKLILAKNDISEK